MKSVYDEVITSKHVCPIKNHCIYLRFIIFPSIRVGISWNLGDNRSLFLKLKSKLGLLYVVLTTPKTPPAKLTLIVAEVRQSPDIKKNESKEEISCLKWIICNGRRKIWVNFTTDTDRLKFVVYRYRNNLYLKENEVDLKLSEHQLLEAKSAYRLSYNDNVLQAVHGNGRNNCSKIKQLWPRMDVFLIMSIFRLYPGLNLSFEDNSVWRNLFLTACFCRASTLSLREMDQNFKFGGTIGLCWLKFLALISPFEGF